MDFRFLIFLISATFGFSMYAEDVSIKDEIKGCDGEIQKVTEQLGIEESKSDKNCREIKYFTGKKKKLLENKLKKIADIKNILEKNVDAVNLEIKKNSEKNKDKDKDKIIKKLQDEKKKYEDEINQLDIDIKTCKAEMKKIVDPKIKNKAEPIDQKTKQIKTRGDFFINKQY